MSICQLNKSNNKTYKNNQTKKSADFVRKSDKVFYTVLPIEDSAKNVFRQVVKENDSIAQTNLVNYWMYTHKEPGQIGEISHIHVSKLSSDQPKEKGTPLQIAVPPKHREYLIKHPFCFTRRCFGLLFQLIACCCSGHSIHCSVFDGWCNETGMRPHVEQIVLRWIQKREGWWTTPSHLTQ